MGTVNTVETRYVCSRLRGSDSYNPWPDERHLDNADHQGRRPEGKWSRDLGLPSRAEATASCSVPPGPAKDFHKVLNFLTVPCSSVFANVFAKGTGYSGAPCTTIGSLSSICLTPFVCGQNCEPGQSLTVTREAHWHSPAPSSSGHRGDLYSRRQEVKASKARGKTQQIFAFQAHQSPRLSSKQPELLKTTWIFTVYG